MKYKKAKEIVIKDFKEKINCNIDLGWKFRWYPSLRKQTKQFAELIKERRDYE